ncbi:putative CRM domain-containing protein [Cucumis melo var. makuwa]|uniref:CRM domain-containing protein n=1 Tax=Cucumis melo var. makuwa TaxID=1194695 RepID=A0A5A7VGF6_CUCMM|nr:putative CRM domain-containing protein [Cucumis melo var. makuwa]
MIVALGFNNVFKYRTSISPLSHCPNKIVEFLLCCSQNCCILKNTRAFNYGSENTPLSNRGSDSEPSLSSFRNMGSVPKNVMFLEKWNSSCNGVYRFTSIVGYRWIHSDKSVEPLEKSEGKSAIGSTDGSGIKEEETKKKTRKKLKGKRAVVRWLKFFRWKKKKEYERMTSEEKILFKMNKARKKEKRLVEALEKIEPANSSDTTHDPEILTPEEHFYFLKMGIKGKNYVPVGRRGIYQGVILNMHLHWKKHQTVKVVVKTFSPEEVKEIAAELARLTGGLVLDIHEENTIIMYRGKNYSQPPTEIMSPRVSLSRRKALFKSKYRDGLRAVRKHIPKLEQELRLLQSQATLNCKSNGDSVEHMQETVNDSNKSKVISSLNLEILDDSTNAVRVSNDWSDDSSPVDTGISSDSEDLSDMFETDIDSEADEKMEKPLFLKEFEKFAAETEEDEMEDLSDQLRQISMDSKQAKILENDVNSPEFDEVDRLFLRSASLLKKKRR